MAMRRLIHAVLEHHDGQLQDDATVLFCEWLGTTPHPTGRAAALAGVPRTAGSACRRPARRRTRPDRP